MLERVKQYILDENLFSVRYKTVFIAVSGGIDSCVLLDILYRLRSELNINPVIVHFNHRVRGRDSQADETFVKNLAGIYGLPVRTGRINRIPARVNETILRQKRLKFFQGLLTQNPQALLATGHTLNDRLETFIMRLVKGSHLRGLLGIRPRYGRIVHPLLGVSRLDIIRYATQRHINYREDRTNKKTEILRNRIRHKVIPYLKKNLGQDIERALLRTLTDLTDHYGLFENDLRKIISHSVTKVNGMLLLNRKNYFRYDSVLRRGLLEYCISEVNPLNYTISDQSLLQWEWFIGNAQSGKTKYFQNKTIAVAEREYIRFGESPRAVLPLKLRMGKKLVLTEEYSLYFTAVSAGQVRFSSDPHIEFVDGAKCGNELTVRSWQHGDSFRPLGMVKDKKLSDFFIDLKLSRTVKQHVPLVCRGSQIVWVAGYRLDDRYKVTKRTRLVYKLELKAR